MANILPEYKRQHIAAAVSDGASIRSVERATGVHRDTIMRLGQPSGRRTRKISFNRRVEITRLLATGHDTAAVMRTAGVVYHAVKNVLAEVGEACLYSVGRTEAEKVKIREWGWKRVDSPMRQKAMIAALNSGMKPEDIVDASDKWWSRREDEQFEQAFSAKFKTEPVAFMAASEFPQRDRATGVGYCACGCGGETSRAENDDRARGLKRGDFSRWIQGHSTALAARQRKASNPGYEPQTERARKRDDLRREMIDDLRRNPGVSRNYVLRKFSEKGWEPESVSRILRSAIEDFSYRLNTGDLTMPDLEPPPPAIPLQMVCWRCKQPFETFQPRAIWCSDACRFPKKSQPYERSEISYEHETELPMLVNQRWVASLDEELYEDGGTRHDTVASAHGFDWSSIMEPEDRDAEYLRAFERTLPSKVAVILRKTLNGESVTRDEGIALKAEALLLFEDFAE